jgi:hypothetical protein
VALQLLVKDMLAEQPGHITALIIRLLAAVGQVLLGEHLHHLLPLVEMAVMVFHLL